MKTTLQNKLSEALLKSNPLSHKIAGNAVINPVSEMPMILTLDQLQPNPDNPRTGRNPRYDEIKNSIRQRGLDSVPKVTQTPGSNVYIFSDGGNTRYQILSELWQETQDERFYRLHVLFKPWPGRLQCLIGHLAENEVRGELTFVEKAQGISTLRTLYEEQQGKKLTLRALAQCITADGLPISISHISKMEDTLIGLAPYLPKLLHAGLGRPQIEQLLSVRSTLKRINEFLFVQNEDDNIEKCLLACFEKTCTEIDGQDYFDYDTFLDELIGNLLRDCSVMGFDYERWLFEFKVNKGKREPKIDSLVAVTDVGTDNAEYPHTEGSTSSTFVTDEEQITITPIPVKEENTDYEERNETSQPVVEIQDDLYDGASVLSGDITGCSGSQNQISAATDMNVIDKSITEQVPVNTSGLLFPQTCHDIWPMSAHLDDIEHIQAQVYRTLFELSGELDLSTSFMAGSGVHSTGFITLAPDNSALSLVMSAFSEEEEHLDDVSMALKRLLTGGSLAGNQPVLNDAQFMKWMKLMYLVRCLYAKQRNVDPDVTDDEEELE